LPERRVGAALRAAREAAGLGLREIARLLHYRSHSTLSEYEAGARMPSEIVVEGYERVLGLPRGTLLALLESANIERHGDPWMKRRTYASVQRTSHEEPTELMHKGIPSTPEAASPPWPPVPVADGADPDAAGCSMDAITVHSRRIAHITRRVVVGHIELRYSRRRSAAWGRFKGYPFLDHLMMQHQDVLIEIGVARLSDGVTVSLSETYCFDFMWGNLVVVDRGPYKSRVSIFVCKELVARGESDAIVLPRL